MADKIRTVKVKTKIPNVEDYVSTKNGKYFKQVSKTALELRLDKIFKNEELKKLNTFIIKPKQAYCTNSELIYPYINYFIKYFDDDKELLVSYYKIKFMIDRKKKYSAELFKDDLYDFILSDTMVDKIKKMVRYNYSIDLSSKKEYKHKSIQFKNEHGLIILAASMAIKIFIPLVTHYIFVNGIKKTDKFLAKMFNTVFEYFEEDNNMKNKIYDIAISKLKTTQTRDKRHWIEVEIFGKDMDSEASDVSDKILTDIIYKCKFEGNVAAFFSEVIKRSVGWLLKEKWKRNLKPINTVKNDDGMSDLDKIEMNMSKMDESFITIGEINAKHVIKKLKRRYGIKHFDEDELKFYMDNVHMTEIQENLFNQTFGKYFGSIRDMYSVDKKKFAKLIILFKRMFAAHGFKIIQHILTGDMKIKPVSKKIPKKELNDILQSGTYKYILKKYRYTLYLIIENKTFRNTLNTLLNSSVTIVDYEYKDKLDRKINIDGNNKLIIAEFLKLIAEVI